MTPEIEDKVYTWIRTNAVDEVQLLDLIMYEHGHEIEPDALRTHIKDVFAEYERERGFWHDITDCDRLDRAFSSLQSLGLVVMENAGFTHEEGLEDIAEALEDTPDREAIRGYCFYSGGDMFDAIQDQGLCLAFGSTDPEAEPSEGVAIGNLVKSELEKAGLVVEWKGTLEDQLSMPGFCWQRRRGWSTAE